MRREIGRTAYGVPCTPPSGAWGHASSFIEGTTGTITSGQVGFSFHDVGPNPLTVQAIGLNTTVAQAGGATTLTLGIYEDDGTGGSPLLSAAGLRFSGDGGLLTTAGLKSAAASLTLQPGRYWLAALYRATTAPTTAPTFTTVSRSQNTWFANGTAIGTLGRGLYVQGQTALPTAPVTLLSNSGTSNPVLALRAA